MATLLPTLLLSGLLLASVGVGTPASDKGPVVQMTVTPAVSR